MSRQNKELRTKDNIQIETVDKMIKKQLAVQNMKMGVGDLLSYYEDTNQSNPKERAYRAFLQQSAPQMYAQQYLMPDQPPGATVQNGQPPAPAAVSTEQPLPTPVQQTVQFAPAPQQPPA